jgi:hypothetical protein
MINEKDQLKEEMKKWNPIRSIRQDRHPDVTRLTDEQERELQDELSVQDYERVQKGMENWTMRDWWEEYKSYMLQDDLHNEWEKEYFNKCTQKLKKRSKEIRDVLAKRLAELPEGEGITTKDLILESPRLIRILVECGYSDIYHPRVLTFIHSQIKRLVRKEWKLYTGIETIESLPISMFSSSADTAHISPASITESMSVAVALVGLRHQEKRRNPTLTAAWFNCTEEQIMKVIENDYKRRMGLIKSLARTAEMFKMPLRLEEVYKQLIEKEPRTVWRDAMIKLVEEENRKNPLNQKLEEKRNEQEREKWK